MRNTNLVIFSCLLGLIDLAISVEAVSVTSCESLATGSTCITTGECPSGYTSRDTYACAEGGLCCERVPPATGSGSKRFDEWSDQCGVSPYADAGVPQTALYPITEAPEDSPEGTNGPPEAQIAGGWQARPAEYPWMVQVWRNGVYKCGGALIDHNRVLTVAHCVSDSLGTFEVAIGAVTRQCELESCVRIPVSQSNIIIHDNYDSATYLHDIAVIILPDPVTFKTEVSPVCAPGLLTDYTGDQAVVSGWGITGEMKPLSDELRFAVVGVLGTCSPPYSLLEVHAENICAGGSGADACTSDSGGPLVVLDTEYPGAYGTGLWTLIGLVSWGEDCGEGVLPGVYTEVASYLYWIESVSEPHAEHHRK